jgi:hypothetical protein
MTGDEHMAVVEEFCLMAKDKWPNCLIQFEDFQTDKAFAILERFRDKFLCFNGVHLLCAERNLDRNAYCQYPFILRVRGILAWSYPFC